MTRSSISSWKLYRTHKLQIFASSSSKSQRDCAAETELNKIEEFETSNKQLVDKQVSDFPFSALSCLISTSNS